MRQRPMLSASHLALASVALFCSASTSAFACRFNPSATAQLVSVAPETPSIFASLKSRFASCETSMPSKRCVKNLSPVTYPT